MAEFDSPWKEAIDLFFEDFLKLFFTKVHRLIDWSRPPVGMDTELSKLDPESEVGKRLADKLFKVWLKDGREVCVMIHIEVQAQVEVRFDERMFIYHYRIYDRFRLPVISLAVLADDDRRWRPSSFEVKLAGSKIRLEFATVKLLDYAERERELEKSSNPFAAVVLAHLKTLATRQDPQSRGSAKVWLAKSLYRHGWDKARVRQLFRVIDWMMELPADRENQFKIELRQFEKEKQMPFITSFEKEGIKKGRKEGRKEGREEGREEGRTAVLQGIEIALECKFGQAGLESMPAIRRIKGLGSLQAVLAILRAAGSVSELQAELLKMTK